VPGAATFDYLVVGAGAAGMAITDELLTHTDATIGLVDRRWAPGGHWLEAYPFVRLHQPSASYGVSSTPLGSDMVDGHGLNAGMYERAGAAEICAYYERVLQHFVGTGRVRWFPSCDFDGGEQVTSRLSGDTTRVLARRRVIDTTYMEGEFPSSSPPPFEVLDGVRCLPVGALAVVDEAPDRYVIIGAGKTALDACSHLLEGGVPPNRIQWIKPREGRWINRRFQQPLALLPETYRGAALQLEAMAAAGSTADLFARLEDAGLFLRIDPETPARSLRGAMLSEAELSLLRTIDDVVRLGHVRRVERDRIVLDHGSVPTTPATVYVHCAARGLVQRPPRKVFDGHRVTVQPTMWGAACYQYAFVGVVEAMLADDDAKNEVCRPIRIWDDDDDYVAAFFAAMRVDRAAAAHPDLARWMKTTRLTVTSGLPGCIDDPAVVEARGRMRAAAPAAYENLQRLLAAAA